MAKPRVDLTAFVGKLFEEQGDERTRWANGGDFCAKPMVRLTAPLETTGTLELLMVIA